MSPALSSTQALTRAWKGLGAPGGSGELHVLLEFNLDSNLSTAEMAMEVTAFVPTTQFLQDYLVL